MQTFLCIFTIQELRILWMVLIHKGSSAMELQSKVLGGSVTADLLVSQASTLRKPCPHFLIWIWSEAFPCAPHSDSPTDRFIHVLSSYSVCGGSVREKIPHRACAKGLSWWGKVDRDQRLCRAVWQLLLTEGYLKDTVFALSRGNLREQGRIPRGGGI